MPKPKLLLNIGELLALFQEENPDLTLDDLVNVEFRTQYHDHKWFIQACLNGTTVELGEL
ncbi:hypothetical protein AHIS2_p076 [Acaryochloris phage A-HIS2]|nr:hypothetical protein AHIS2_p076 [Acaryochloris phage A-HIS2]